MNKEKVDSRKKVLAARRSAILKLFDTKEGKVVLDWLLEQRDQAVWEAMELTDQGQSFAKIQRAAGVDDVISAITDIIRTKAEGKMESG